MPKARPEQSVFEFLTYPQVGGDDWAYMSQSAQVRTLEMQLLSRTVLMDMANAPDFSAAVASLAAGEYALPQGSARFEDVQTVLLEKRANVRELFADWMLDAAVVALFKSRHDFANLRLALRRTLTDRPFGADYSEEGNMPPELIEHVLEEENYDLFPPYMRRATEQAVLGYYQNKDIRQIDYAIDQVEADHKLAEAARIESVFLLNLFRIQVDLTNIRTMLRLRFADAQHRQGLLAGGFVELERFRQGLELGSEALGQLFFATPYHRIVDAGVAYLTSSQSFLKVEQLCDEYLIGFLRSTGQVTAGPQVIVAYLLMKEHEIRTVRLILTAKKNLLDTKLILDRVA
ncbi:MAG: V-type ATPase subunit [Sedimentisphaerales bacterium]|nr:V-type ATPase subunit [Sedimentisphaerales bacterium]